MKMRSIKLFALIFIFFAFITPMAEAELILFSDDEFDNRKDIGNLLASTSEIKALNQEFQAFEISLSKLNTVERKKRLGKPGQKSPATYALPIFANEVFMVGGLGLEDEGAKTFYAIDELAGVEFYSFRYSEGNVVSVAKVYFHVDKSFIPVKSKADLPRRLSWDKERFKAIKVRLGVL